MKLSEIRSLFDTSMKLNESTSYIISLFSAIMEFPSSDSYIVNLNRKRVSDMLGDELTAFPHFAQ